MYHTSLKISKYKYISDICICHLNFEINYFFLVSDISLIICYILEQIYFLTYYFCMYSLCMTHNGIFLYLQTFSNIYLSIPSFALRIYSKDEDQESLKSFVISI